MNLQIELPDFLPVVGGFLYLPPTDLLVQFPIQEHGRCVPGLRHGIAVYPVLVTRLSGPCGEHEVCSEWAAITVGHLGQKTMDPKEPILGMGPLPEMTNGDRGPFGADFVFSARARQSGYKHWVDCNPVAEARHAATVFLDRKLYKKVRGWQVEKAADHWKKIWQLNLEVRGMDAKTADARVKQLQLIRKGFADSLRDFEDQAAN